MIDERYVYLVPRHVYRQAKQFSLKRSMAKGKHWRRATTKNIARLRAFVPEILQFETRAYV
jgi:hypothetical protein